MSGTDLLVNHAMKLVLIAILAGLFASKVPSGASYQDIIQIYQPQLQTAVIWIITAITLLIAWYRVPVHAVHRAILIGFAAYLLIFTTLLNVLRDFGFDNLRNFI